MNESRPDADWVATPESAIEYWNSLTFREQIALEYASNEARKTVWAQADALYAEIQARYGTGEIK